MNSFSLSRSGKTIKAPLLALCAALAMTSVSCRAADAPPAKAAPAKPAANVAKQEPIDFFKAGQTWGFLGDSITHGGDYHQHIQLFLATRYPGRDLWTRNFGRSGDSAKAMLRDKRINADLGQNTPDIVFVHLGMNDVGRDGYDNNKQSLPRTKETGNTDFYAERMEEVADRVRELGAKVVILSPTIYDNEGGKEEGRNSRRGLDEQLGVYGEAGGELAARKGYGFIDVHTPMAQLSAERRKQDVSWSLTRDRVHPSDGGHEVLAYYILKSLKPQPYVYRVEIDAAKDKFEAQGATVVEHQATPQKVSFVLNESALPYPLTESDKGYKDVPFVADLNQQTLRVAGLNAGRYEIRIDGAAVAQVEAKELATGINLATNEKTPQYQAAMKIRELMSPEKKVLERAERDLSVTMLSVGPSYTWETDDANALKALDKWVADLIGTRGERSTKGWTGYLISQNRKYIPQRGEIKTKLAELRKQLAATPRESKHSYEITRVAG